MAEAVVFDLEGTLIDMVESHVKAYDEVLAAGYGSRFVMDDLIAGYGKAPWRIVQMFLQRNGVSASERQCRLIADEKQKILRAKYAGLVAVLPGVRALLKSLKDSKMRLAVASSSPRENVKFMLAAPGLRDFFDVVVAGEDVREAKPDPALFLLTAQRLGVNPPSCAAVEDSTFGVEAAKAAGMKVVAVMTGGRKRDELEALGPDLVIKDLTEASADTFRRL
jgi:beta-phosphoglucomutase family hydrolase